MSIQISPVSCGFIEENAYIVWLEGCDDCVVVDPGDEPAKLERGIGEKKVSAILLTHGHFDHIGAVAALAGATGAPVYVGAGDMEMLNDARLNGYTTLMGGTRMQSPPVAAQPFAEALSAAGMDFSILPTPGHSKGSVCLYYEKEGALFSGDTLFRGGYGRLDLHGGSPSDMAKSLKRLFMLPPATRVYPGHGEATTIGEEGARYRL